MIPVSKGFLFLLTLVAVVLLIFIIRKLVKYLVELTENSTPPRPPRPPRPPVPSKYVEDKKVNKRSKIYLKTVYIPKSPKKDIDRICQSIVDKEYKNGYIINDINTQMDSTGGIYLFLRFVRF